MAVLWAGSACTGSRLDADFGSAITTELDPATLSAGASAAIHCGGKVGVRPIPTADFTARVTPLTGVADGAVVTGAAETLSVQGLKVGTYRVACGVAGLDAWDPDGAILTVTAGAPVATHPVFGENPVQAGKATTLVCVARDAYGNETPLNDAQFDVPPELTAAAGQISGTTAGRFSVTCGLADDVPRNPSELLIIPGDLVRVDLIATPARAGYSPGAVVTLSWTAYDAFDNAVEDLPGALVAPTSPPGVVTLDEATHRFRLTREGRFTFTVTLAEPWQNLADSLEILVDGTKPTIELDYPPRGATIATRDHAGGSLTARGRVVDVGGVDTLTVNGRAVTLDAAGRFTAPLEPRWGVNAVELHAVDLAGNSASASPSYAYADDWTSFVGSTARSLQLPDGVVALLGQNFFDDGVHTQPLNDLATLLESLVGTLDIRTPIMQALSGVNQTFPLVNQTQTIDIIPNISWVDLTYVGTFAITLEAAETTGVGPTRVDIDSRTGGLDLDFVLGTDTAPAFGVDLVFKLTLRFDVLVEGCSPLGCLPLPAGVALGEARVTSHLALGDLDVHMKTDIAKRYQQPMQLAMTELNSVIGDFQLEPIQDIVFHVSVSGIQGVAPFTFDWPLSSVFDLGQLSGSLLNPIADAVAGTLPALINPLIQGLVGPALAGVFDLLVLDTTLPVPNLFGGAPLDLDLSTELATIDFTDDGGTVGLAVGLFADQGIDLPALGHPGDLHEEAPKGAILRGDCVGTSVSTLQWGWNPSVGFGVRTDVLNAAFFAAWWAGALNAPLDLGALMGGGGGMGIPLEGLAIDMEWLLPPVVNDCSKAGLEAQVGDLYLVITGTVFGFPLEVALYADLGLAVSFQSYDGSNGGPKGLSLKIGQLTRSDLEVVYLDDGGLGGAFDVESLIQSLPSLLGSLVAGQELGPFELPSLDLGTVIPGLPAGTTLGLGNLSVTTQAGYAVLGGDLGP